MKKNTGKILITDEVHELLIYGLEQDGFAVDYKPLISADEVFSQIDDYEGLIVNSKVFVGRDMMDKAKALKFVCRAGSGLEVIDLVCAAEKNIAAFNSPEGNCNAVAEFALGALLNMMRNISKSNAEVEKHEWKREENRGHELSGKTVGMIAFGNTAQAFAKLLRGFDVQILGYDKYYHEFSAGNVRETPLSEIFEKADVLSLHLPLTAETEYMIDGKFLRSFKKPLWLLNTSRGKVLRTAEMLECIKEGRIIAAALDVLENEKVHELSLNEKEVFGALVAEKRIFLSPHIAGWTHESKRKIAETLLQKIRALYLA